MRSHWEKRNPQREAIGEPRVLLERPHEQGGVIPQRNQRMLDGADTAGTPKTRRASWIRAASSPVTSTPPTVGLLVCVPIDEARWCVMSDPTYEYRVLTADGQHFTADDSATPLRQTVAVVTRTSERTAVEPHRVERRSIGVWEPVERRQVMSAAEFPGVFTVRTGVSVSSRTPPLRQRMRSEA